jgi:hypothetical protein
MPTDHVAVNVEGRTTGVAVVHRRVDLDEVVIRTGADVASASRDDAGRHRSAEAERVADSNHPVADPRRLIGKFDEGKIAAPFDLDEC